MTYSSSILVTLLFFVTLFITYRARNKSSGIGLFVLIILGIVNISRYILAIFLPEVDILQGSWIFWGEVSNQAFIKTTLCLSAVLIGILFNELIYKKPILKPKYKSNFNLLVTSYLVLMIGSISLIYRSLKVKSFIETDGYLATFTSSLDLPTYINIGIALPHVAFYSFIASNPSKKHFIIFASLYLAVLASSLATGQRTEFMIASLLVIWSGFYLGYIQKLHRFLPLGFVFVFLAIFINSWRLDEQHDYLGVIEFMMFFWGQGVTLLVNFGLFENEELFFFGEGWFFVNKFISCDIAPYFTGNYCIGETAANVSGVWWQKLSHTLDSQTFYLGGGLGGSMVGSLYLLFNSGILFLDVIVLALTSFFFMRLSYNIVSSASRGHIRALFATFFMHQLIFFPRAGLDIFIPHPRVIFGFMVLIIIYFFVCHIAKSQSHIARIKKSYVN